MNTHDAINARIKDSGVDTNLISDGYHTFGELYEHRITLFIALCRHLWNLEMNEGYPSHIWRSRRHSDGELAFGGSWFVLGIGEKKGEQITYHLPLSKWDECKFAPILDRAPDWDGHTSADVLERLKQF